VPDDPTRWILFEVYTDRAAHAAHRQSAHFMAYDAVAERAVTEKSVVWAVDKHFTG
jgi:quinol monooxygenase YgiN